MPQQLLFIQLIFLFSSQKNSSSLFSSSLHYLYIDGDFDFAIKIAFHDQQEPLKVLIIFMNIWTKMLPKQWYKLAQKKRQRKRPPTMAILVIKFCQVLDLEDDLKSSHKQLYNQEDDDNDDVKRVQNIIAFITF